uniref:Ubiquitin/40s ribosomal protein s27a fusion n=1 Tax=Rhipicephalus zambeziensis TaxID=60191 RepID=A0A224ZAW2_9ACAR
MKGGLLLDVVVGQCAAVLELLSGKDETLLIWRDAFLVLNLCLDILNSVTGLDFERDGLSGECLDKNLHATTESQHQVKGGLFLDIVVRECAAVL